MRVLGLSGSLRDASTNTAVLRAAALLARPPVTVALYEGLGTLPHFNPDRDGDDPPEPVLDLRRQVGRCDALLICSPEYARGVPGAFKNALDWLVGSSEFPGKPVAVVNASPRATAADASLRLTLETMSARVVERASITLPLLGRGLDAAGIAADPDLARRLVDALEALAEAAGARRDGPGLASAPSSRQS